MLLFLFSTSHPLEAQKPIPETQELLKKSQSKKLAQSPHWLALGHYRKTWFGIKSDVDAKAFFISPKGKKDPEAELEATILSFFDVNVDTPTICRFPARTKWILEELNLKTDQIPQPQCPALQNWLSLLPHQSAHLIFASAYLYNPASMYGHTFIRLDKDSDASKDPGLLSYSVNFAAETNGNMGAGYAIKGLSGAYPGKFTTVPYYMKIQEYSNLDNRDLWEYQLNLNTAELRDMVLHLWELGPVYINYYFFTENCSYQLLPLLDIARPGLNLKDKFRWMTIPIDTIREVKAIPGLVKDHRVRLSAVTKMLSTRSKLSKNEIKIAERIARKMDVPIQETLAPLSKNRKGPVLRSAFQYFRFLNDHARFQDLQKDVREHAMLIELNKHSVPDEIPVLPAKATVSPEEGHKSSRAMWSFGSRMGQRFQEISLRPALHDFLDPSEGYIPLSQLEMFHLKGRFIHSTEKIFIHEFTFARLASFSPWDRWVRKPSFNLSGGLESRSDVRDQSWDRVYGRLRGGAGLTFAWEPLGQSLALYNLPQLDIGAGPAFEKKNRVGALWNSGIILESLKTLRTVLEANYHNYFIGDESAFWSLRASQAFSWNKSAQVRFSFQKVKDIEEWQSSINFYW